MIYDQKRQNETKHSRSYGAKHFIGFGQKWQFWSRRVTGGEV